MSSVHDLLTANLLRVFNNRDATDRRRAIEETYTDDVTFLDPDGTVVGRDALDQKAGDLLAGVPANFEFVAAGPRYEGTDAGALSWAFGPPDGAVARGIDIITTREGRICSLHTMLVEATGSDTRGGV